jgi:hypothetical protein
MGAEMQSGGGGRGMMSGINRELEEIITLWLRLEEKLIIFGHPQQDRERANLLRRAAAKFRKDLCEKSSTSTTSFS